MDTIAIKLSDQYGRAEGKTDLYSICRLFKLVADATVDSMFVNNIDIPVLQIHLMPAGLYKLTSKHLLMRPKSDNRI